MGQDDSIRDIVVDRMNIKWKKILRSKYFIVIIIIILLYFTIGRFSLISSSYSPAIRDVFEMLEAYIEANNGNFPESENDLIQQGFFAREENPDGTRYRIRFDTTNPNETYYTRYFDEFTIAYGVKCDDIELRNERLYDKNTQKQILLIDGPHKIILNYVSPSIHLYKKMVKLKGKNN